MTQDKETLSTQERPAAKPAKPSAAQADAPVSKDGGGARWVWPIVSMLLALAAWAAVMWIDGYLSMALGALGAVAGIIGSKRRFGAWRNLAITSVIASLVLVVVVASYLIVLKIGLGA